MSGGGKEDVGTVRPTMQMLTWDEKTRPMSRWDMLAFCTKEENLNEKEKAILGRCATIGPLSVAAGAAVGWNLQKLFGWKSMARKQPAFKPLIPAFRVSLVGFCMGLPYLVVQQWTVDEILKLDEDESMLAFHTKRFMVMQRNQLIFQRQAMREITKEEQEAMGAASLEQRRANAMLASGGARGSQDVNSALLGQSLTPVAQTGYKS